MVRKIMAVAAIVVAFGGSAVQAKEPLLKNYGLSSLKRMSDSEGRKVRGMAVVTASGLSSISAIFYSPATGERLNVDAVNFSLASDIAVVCATPADATQSNYSVIQPMSVTFGDGSTRTLSAIAAGQSQAILASGLKPGLIAPITIP